MNNFEKATSHVPVTSFITGIASLDHFEQRKEKLDEIQQLKRRGLNDEEIYLYNDYKSGKLSDSDKYKSIEGSALREKLDFVLSRVLEDVDVTDDSHPIVRPIDCVKQLESDLFSHHSVDHIPSINKRRKLLRRIDRKLQNNTENSHITPVIQTSNEKESLWDVRHPTVLTARVKPTRIIGPRLQTLYTIRNKIIVRLKPGEAAYEATELILPTNQAEKDILEGTKLTVDDIRKLPKFHDYASGEPSNILFLKNFSNTVTAQELKNLFKNSNISPDVRLMTGRMRGQAFATFSCLEDAHRCLNEFNGLIFKSKPLIIQYGKGKNTVK